MLTKKAVHSGSLFFIYIKFAAAKAFKMLSETYTLEGP